MQTSRIRHALSSVQLFIERCLMNLETKVSPSTINAKQWAWMKRYRVWEANRKVFLYPENWLEPELRDDQSPFFKEAMSELLQGDITEDRAAVTLLNYLAKLDKVAKLEPCGIHFVEEKDIAHVVARTAVVPHEYFYRRREFGNWTPWEELKLGIEENPVIPVVWNNRLFLFWLRLLKQTSLEGQKPGQPVKPLSALTTDDIKSGVPMTVYAVLCWSEYYNGKWQPTKISDIDSPTKIGDFSADKIRTFNRQSLKLTAVEWPKGLTIVINGYSDFESWFVLYNTHSLPIRKEDWSSAISSDKVHLPPLSRTLSSHVPRIREDAPDDIPILYNFVIDYKDPNVHNLQRNLRVDPVDTKHKRKILQFSTDIDHHFTEPNHRMQNPWDAPFFYKNSHHVFYVSTKEQSAIVRRYFGYGVMANPPREFQIPPVVVAPLSPIRDRSGSMMTDPRVATLDSTPLQRLVSEDAYIKKGIVIPGTIRYGDKDIGPTGILIKQINQ
jgi:hypothetical protein